ncbi:multivesicular body subunit 12A isoform X2 [Colius striatus]|uniref:multivesicular body subunit 12A isoform X2 n=1 Tax=Colius striatus TaxID=57412 RepID=UPI002B1DF3F6|nr:multivesicular body subunit 12A isoform X2 [Colius striatus]
MAATEAAAPLSGITASVEGAAANLGKGFGHKGGAFLCVSGGAEAAPGPVVTDVLVLSERSPQPPGYTRAPEFPELRPGLSRKKRLYVKLSPPAAAATAVFALQLSSRSKALPHHMKIGEVGNFAIWCKKGPVVRAPAEGQPLSAGLKQLSLSDQSARGGVRRGPEHEALADSSIYGLSAMDGVPFALHPRFQSKLRSSSTGSLADLSVKSLAYIEREYDYGFVVERTAAARLPPGVC